MWANLDQIWVWDWTKLKNSNLIWVRKSNFITKFDSDMNQISKKQIRPSLVEGSLLAFCSGV